ncbi:hypothetical protein Plhal304r1_c017g0061251 [Plasmopara halstedii]
MTSSGARRPEISATASSKSDIVENKVKSSLLLPKGDVLVKEEEADVVTILHKFIPNMKTLHLLKMFMADNEGVKDLEVF